MRLDDLPDENLHAICKFLDVNTLISGCMLVSNRWSIIASEIDLHIEICRNNKKATRFISSIKSQQSKLFKNIKSLVLRNNNLHSLYNLLEESKKMMNLIDLDISNNHVYVPPEKFRNCKFENLQSLNISFTCIFFSFVKNDLFGEGSTFRNLTSFDLSFQRLDVDCVEYLSNNLMQLKILKMRGCFIGNTGVKIICDKLEHLTCLDVSINALSNIGMRYIADSKFMKQLTSLNINKNNMSDNIWKEFFSNPNISNLKSLDMSRNEFSSMPYLSTSQYLNNITDLNISKCDRRLYNFLNIESLKGSAIALQLVSLNLDSNSIGDRRIGNISDCKNLRELNLSRNDLSCKGAIVISEFDMPHLVILNLRGNIIKRLGISALENSETLPNIRIQGIDISKFW